MYKSLKRKVLPRCFRSLTVVPALSFGVGTARAGDDVTRTRSSRAHPEKKPLTRAFRLVSADALTAEQSKFVSSVRGRHAFAVGHRTRRNPTIVKDKPKTISESTSTTIRRDISANVAAVRAGDWPRAATNADLKFASWSPRSYRSRRGEIL